MKTIYGAGQRAALQKLGFLDAIDPEDLPRFLAARREAQRQKQLQMQAMTGLPAGGNIQGDYGF